MISFLKVAGKTEYYGSGKDSGPWNRAGLVREMMQFGAYATWLWPDSPDNQDTLFPRVTKSFDKGCKRFL